MILNVVTVVQFLYWIYSDALGGEIAIPCAQADADHGGFPQKGPAEMSSRLVLVDLWENYGQSWENCGFQPEILETGSIDLVLSCSLATSLSKNTLSTNITVSH